MTTAPFSMLQMEENLSAEVDQAERHFAEMQRLVQDVTQATLERKAYIFSQEATNERKHAAALRRQALEISRRECLRDTWVAHTGNVQASLFVATVLIGFGYELLSGAIVSREWHSGSPASSSVGVFVFFVASLLSIALGTIAVSLLLARYRRLSRFDFETPWREYSCGHAHPEMVEYCECRCRGLERWAHYVLVASVVAGSAAVMIYSVDKFTNAPSGGEAAKSFAQLLLLANGSAAAYSGGNNETSIKRISAIRSVGAPVVFCLIVGCSVVALVVLDFSAVLGSDTLQKRPDVETSLDSVAAATSAAEAAMKAKEDADDVAGVVPFELDDGEDELVRQSSTRAVASP